MLQLLCSLLDKGPAEHALQVSPVWYVYREGNIEPMVCKVCIYHSLEIKSLLQLIPCVTKS